MNDPHNPQGLWEPDPRGYLTLEAGIRYRLRAVGVGSVRVVRTYDSVPLAELTVNDAPPPQRHDHATKHDGCPLCIEGVPYTPEPPTPVGISCEFQLPRVNAGVSYDTWGIQVQRQGDEVHWSVRPASLSDEVHTELDRREREAATAREKQKP